MYNTSNLCMYDDVKLQYMYYLLSLSAIIGKLFCNYIILRKIHLEESSLTFKPLNMLHTHSIFTRLKSNVSLAP